MNISVSPIRATDPTYLILYAFITEIFTAEYFSSYYRIGPNILHTILSNVLNIYTPVLG
jgi:hypothetical protein